jgi:hypothetical protein
VSLRFSGLPETGADKLIVYAFGPGFGECIVLGGPGGEWVVVDCCRAYGACVPLEFLKHLGVERIDAFILTHPDLDHLEGTAQLLGEMKVDKVLRFPVMDSLVALVASAMDRDSKDVRLGELRTALEALDVFDKENGSVEATYRTTRTMKVGELELDVLAPLPADRRHANRAIREAIDPGNARLGTPLVDWLRGKRKTVPGGRNNVLSVAVSVSWASHRVLLMGDVEAGGGRKRGLDGMVAALKEDGHLHLLSGVSCVKAPHHGSSRSFSSEAWNLHSNSEANRVPVAVVAPWDRGEKSLPDSTFLKSIQPHVKALALTSLSDRIDDRLTRSKWHRAAAVSVGTSVSSAAVVFHRDIDRPPEVSCSGTAAQFTPPR